MVSSQGLKVNELESSFWITSYCAASLSWESSQDKTDAP